MVLHSDAGVLVVYSCPALPNFGPQLAEILAHYQQISAKTDAVGIHETRTKSHGGNETTSAASTPLNILHSLSEVLINMRFSVGLIDW